MKDIATGIGIL